MQANHSFLAVPRHVTIDELKAANQRAVQEKARSRKAALEEFHEATRKAARERVFRNPSQAPYVLPLTETATDLSQIMGLPARIFSYAAKTGKGICTTYGKINVIATAQAPKKGNRNLRVYTVEWA